MNKNRKKQILLQKNLLKPSNQVRK